MINAIPHIQCVNDVCTINPPLSAEANTSLPLIMFYMNLMKVQAAAIVDENNHCIGFVIGDDFMNYVNDGKKSRKDPCVADIMRSPNMSVYSDESVEQALIMMRLHKIDWLPVIDFKTQKFSGLICREDIESRTSNTIPFLKRKFSYEETM